MEINVLVMLQVMAYFLHTGSYAQDTCSKSKFGPGCRLTCHCINGETCDQSTGQCPSSMCDKGWHGPNCQMENVALNKKVALRKPHVARLALPAIDGNYTTCFDVSGSSTQRLRVDLGPGFKREIYKINIHDDLSMAYAQRVSQRTGLKVVVSPSKTVGEGVECTALSDNDITQNGIYDMNCRNVAGRYVFIIKKNNPRVLGFCEVETYVCSPFAWGTDCGEVCGYCSNNETCDKVTGQCENGCMSGWTGCDCKTAQPVPDGSHYCTTDTPTTRQTDDLTTDIGLTTTTQAITPSLNVSASITMTTDVSTAVSPKVNDTITTTTVVSTQFTSGDTQTTDLLTNESTTVSDTTQIDTTTLLSGIGPVMSPDNSTGSTVGSTTDLGSAGLTYGYTDIMGPKSLENATQEMDNTTSVYENVTVSMDNTTDSNVTENVTMASSVSMDNTTHSNVPENVTNASSTESSTDNTTDSMLNTTSALTDSTSNMTASDVTTQYMAENITQGIVNSTQDQSTDGMNSTTNDTFQTTVGLGTSTLGTGSDTTTPGVSMTTEMTQVPSGVPERAGRTDGSGLNAVLYIIVPICIVLMVILLTLLGVFLIRRQGKNYGVENGMKSSVPLLSWNGGSSSGAYMAANKDEDSNIDGLGVNAQTTRFSSFNKDRPITTAVPVSSLQDHISMMHLSQQFKTEYESLPKGMVFLHNVGTLDVNIEKNRYKDLIAYDDSRVILLDENLYSNQDATDYINAAYIDGFGKEKAYIAAQGPKNNTVEDFWRMVWQEQSGAIVMLTNLQEGNKIKCFQYWPVEDHNLLAGDISLSLEREIVYPVFIVRKLLLHHNPTNEDRNVSLFHYTAWPDHGLPDPFQILTFHRAVINHQSPLEGPMIVHCSAGVGRTGVFIGFDALKQQGESTGYIGVLEFVKAMRKKRPNVIQTQDQYIFLYVVLLEHFACQEAVLNGLSLQSIMSSLSDVKYKGRIEREYKSLQSMKPKYAQEDYTASLRPENLGKNRDVNILAVDKYRPFLSSVNANPGETPYINAIIMPSCARNDGFLVTQIPFKSTILDLWQMIFDYNSNTIVTLDKFDEDLEESGIFWPAVDESMSVGSFTVTTTSCTEPSGSIAEKMIKLIRKNARDEEEELVIKMLSITDWGPAQDTPKTPRILTNLYSSIQTWQSDNGQWPVTVICRDGASRCGLFCAAVNLIDKIDWYNDIDVFHTVRQLHIRRPEIFPSKEQYEMCYQVAKTYMDNADSYRNQPLEVPQSPV